MRYETVVETTSDGQLVLRLVLVQDEPSVHENEEYNQERGVIIINPVEDEEETPGVITWQM
tara:strand:+ start:191 stop:373 length:183 start_codon:yes stop_codon:yes gene_type:complete